MIPLEVSFKAKVRAASRSRELKTDELWQLIAVERLLARISASSFADRFVLKGGMLLMTYLELGRGTQDVDFALRRVEWESGDVQRIFTEICSTDLQDHFTYDEIQVRPLAHPSMPIPGHRIRLRARFGRTRYVLTVDTARGDQADPIRRQISLSQFSYEPLVGGKVEIQCNPPELIFAEKLQAITERIETTSRMKDFYDLRRITQARDLLDMQRLHGMVASVFAFRNTQLHIPLPPVFHLQPQWARFCTTLPEKTRQQTPKQIDDLVVELNGWLERNLLVRGG